MRFAAALVVAMLATGCCGRPAAAEPHRAVLHGLRPGLFAPTLTPASGRAGTAVTIRGAIPCCGEDGRPVRELRLVVWWNFDPRYLSPRVRVPTPDGSGRLIELRSLAPAPDARRYRATFRVPRVPAGTYVVGGPAGWAPQLRRARVDDVRRHAGELRRRPRCRPATRLCSGSWVGGL